MIEHVGCTEVWTLLRREDDAVRAELIDELGEGQPKHFFPTDVIGGMPKRPLGEAWHALWIEPACILGELHITPQVEQDILRGGQICTDTKAAWVLSGCPSAVT